MLPEEIHPAGEKVEIIQRLIVKEQCAKPEGKGEKKNTDHPGQTALQHTGTVQKSQAQQALQDQDDDHTDKVFRNSHKNLKKYRRSTRSSAGKEKGRSIHSRRMKFNKKGLTNAKL